MKPAKNKKIPVYSSIPEALLNGTQDISLIPYGNFEKIQPSTVGGAVSLKLKGSKRYYYMNYQMAKLYKVV